MFLVKAALITNHPELGIRSQPYSIPANLEAIAMQLSLIRGKSVKQRDLYWGIHGNAVFVTLPEGKAPFHFTGCKEHMVEFTGPTFLFYSPIEKQYEAKHLSRAGVFHHICTDMKHGDPELIQHLFSHGRGNTQLRRATGPLLEVDEVSREPRADARVRKGTGEKFGEGDPMTALFDELSAAGFDMKLLEIDGKVIGLAAAIDEPAEPMAERELVEDPGFYADRPQRGHCVSLTIVSEVHFDPVHYPSPASFVMAIMAGYARALHLNVMGNTLEPEYGSEYLADMAEFIAVCEQQIAREPAYKKLESPLLAKLPDEKGGMGRDS